MAYCYRRPLQICLAARVASTGPLNIQASTVGAADAAEAITAVMLTVSR